VPQLLKIRDPKVREKVQQYSTRPVTERINDTIEEYNHLNEKIEEKRQEKLSQICTYKPEINSEFIEQNLDKAPLSERQGHDWFVKKHFMDPAKWEEKREDLNRKYEDIHIVPHVFEKPNIYKISAYKD